YHQCIHTIPTRRSSDLALGEFCMANSLYFLATKEFDEAAKLDKSLEEKAKKRREEAHGEDARSRFEEAKRQAAEKKYDEANKTRSEEHTSELQSLRHLV